MSKVAEGTSAAKGQGPSSGQEPVIVQVVKAQDASISELLHQVFPQGEPLDEASADGRVKAVSLTNLGSHLDHRLCIEVDKHYEAEEPEPRRCRLGPIEVIFDVSANVGTVLMEPDRLGLSSHSNFSTMKANCCVYRGRWLYEVMLGSKGVMQLGWCTAGCRFSQEEGVGDTRDSYAYDGSRKRKWNGTTQKYGENWLTGDVITCTIDCDRGTIGFYRNGRNLGEAFTNLRLGPKYAYFPAVSLSVNEHLRINFGATPLKYPIDGFRSLQEPPSSDVVRTDLLLSYVETLLQLCVAEDKANGYMYTGGGEDIPPPPLGDARSRHGSILLVAAHVFHKLSPYLRSAYVTDACLLRLLVRLNDMTVVDHEQPLISRLLDLMWTFMQNFEIKSCLEHLAVSLVTAYRFSPASPDFRFPKLYLTLLLAVLRHQQTRRHLLEHVLFDKLRFPYFLHIKPLDDAGLAEVTPTVWWDGMHVSDSAMEQDQEQIQKQQYLDACENLRFRIEEVENIQVELLKVLMYNKDLLESKTSRLLFIDKFRMFLKENSGSTRLSQQNVCPQPVVLCFFHRMVQALRYYWDLFQGEDISRFVLSEDAFMPIQEFWSDSRDYFEYQRCGGSMSHLNRMLGQEVNKAQGFMLKDGQVVTLEKAQGGSGYPDTEMPSGNSLMELLDGVMLLYHIAAHKQLSKMDGLRENMGEFVSTYIDTTQKIQECPPEMGEVRGELERARAVFLDKITEQARQMAWIRAAVYSQQKQQDVAWLLSVALTTVEKASGFKMLFLYMPEFYLEIVINSYNALRNYFHPTVSMESLEDYDDLVQGFATFLVHHFSDSRIVISDSRDNIIQSLACFTCYEQSLKILEALPLQICNSLVTSLIAPYENRSWAQTNWVLVRIWKGCGFGFRYTHLPHLVPSKIQLTEFGTASLQKPCPSPKFQSMLSEVLLKEADRATKFLSTLLNQLNWSFSEFIGMMQEIQQVITRSEHRLLLETRQLKICGTCFEISVCLFRVLEMIVNIAPQLFFDWTRPSAELLINRLIQLTCLVLNRVTMKKGMFDNVVNMYITGLESVTHYPVLAVVTGTLCQLVLRSGDKSGEMMVDLLLSDPGFQVSSLEFMLGGSDGAGEVQAARQSGERIFDFRNYTEVSAEEVESVEQLITRIKERQQTFVLEEKVVRDEDLCTICYASSHDATFMPCGHKSCRTCITHQLLSKKECFFCKAVITSVEDTGGNTILADNFR